MIHVFFPIFLVSATSARLSANESSHIPSYKFGILDGEPASLNGSISVTVTSFDECVDKCELDSECIMASQRSDSEPCNLFSWNSVTEVKRNDSGGVGQVAFRVYTEQPSCELNLRLLLNGKLYPLHENNTKEFLWRVDTSEEGWTIQYIWRRSNEMKCGNWTYLRPYSDGCDPDCLLTMVQIYADPGPLAPSFHNTSNPISNWDGCMQWCYTNAFCFIAFWNEGYCNWYGIDDTVYFLNKQTAASGMKMVVKLNLNSETCKFTTDQLLNDTYYMADGTDKTLKMNFTTLPGKPDLPFYRVRTTDKFYVLTYYGNEETKNLKNGYGCPVYFDTDHLGLQVTPSQLMCTRPFQFSGISQPVSKEYCELLGGHLWVERSSMFLNSGDTQRLLAPDVFGKEWGFGRLGGYNWKIWLGLEPDPECYGLADASYCNGNQNWKYSNPSWPMLTGGASSIAFSWAPQEPKINSDYQQCAYLKVESSGTPPVISGHSIFSTPCTDDSIDGFVCGTETQQHMGLPKYGDMMTKYEYDFDLDL